MGLWLDSSNPREALEHKLRNGKKLLLALSHQHDEMPLRAYTFDRATLATTPLYMIGGDASDHFVYIDSNGRVHIDGKLDGELREQGRLLMAPDATALFVSLLGRPCVRHPYYCRDHDHFHGCRSLSVSEAQQPVQQV